MDAIHMCEARASVCDYREWSERPATHSNNNLLYCDTLYLKKKKKKKEQKKKIGQ